MPLFTYSVLEGPFIFTFIAKFLKNVCTINTVKPLNRGHLRALKNLSVIERCPLLGGNLIKIVTFRTKFFVRYSWDVHYWEVSLYYPMILLPFESYEKLYMSNKTFIYIFNSSAISYITFQMK